LRINLIQLNPIVGNIEKNCDLIIRHLEASKGQLCIFPELALSGYPPEDLLFHSGIQKRISNAIDILKNKTLEGVSLILGTPYYEEGKIFNAALYIHNGKIESIYKKRCLPNYSVFDEKRYFSEGIEPTLINHEGVNFALLICEDFWDDNIFSKSFSEKTDCIIVINGSPFDCNKIESRRALAIKRSKETELPVIYVNLVGGQDELIFDGSSFILNSGGEEIIRTKPFEEGSVSFEFSSQNLCKKEEILDINNIELIYNGLVLGTRDYIQKNNFSSVLLGLSGGIDSALTLAIVCDAIGAEGVRAVMMPSKFTSNMSVEDAKSQADLLRVKLDVIDISDAMNTFDHTLRDVFHGYAKDVTEENIQSRIRGLILMSLSNKFNSLLLTTGNKSEMAVGYSTLYGDMAGGFAPIKDCSKTLVYELARYVNSITSIIPKRVIEREPSAELAPEQKDTDSLPPYDVLDPILELFIEHDCSVDQIEKNGFDRNTVIKVLNLVKRNEYKRRQAPPGVKITSRAFGKDWRYPITSGY